jgi:hypothetical protein
MRAMTEAQAWEQLYGRRSPDVRVLGRTADTLDGDQRGQAGANDRDYVARAESPPSESEAHAA